MAVITPPARINKYAGGSMATPDAAKRKKLAKAGKAQPDGSYPTDTPGRAVAAKGYSTTAVKDGRMSKSTKAKIDARANKELGTGLINRG